MLTGSASPAAGGWTVESLAEGLVVASMPASGRAPRPLADDVAAGVASAAAMTGVCVDVRCPPHPARARTIERAEPSRSNMMQTNIPLVLECDVRWAFGGT